MATDAELLADLLDGRLDRADVPPEIARLGDLATSVGEHITLVPPTPRFREALREELLEAVGGPGGPGTSGGSSTGAVGGSPLGPAGGAVSGGAAGATSAASGISAAIAAVAATAVLATSTYAVTTESVPGDPLYGLKQGIESLQLALADDHRDVELLVGFATERVREAVGLADPAVVTDLLDESERLLDDALALADGQGREVEDLLGRYAGALVTLDSRTEDPTVRAVVDQLLGDIGVARSERDPGAGPLPGDGGDGAPDGSGDLPEPGEEPGEPQETPSEGVTGGPTEGTDGPLDDPLDELDDPLDELDDPLDELDDPLDELDDALDGVTGTSGN